MTPTFHWYQSFIYSKTNLHHKSTHCSTTNCHSALHTAVSSLLQCAFFPVALPNRLAPREPTVADFGHFLYSSHVPTFQNSTLGNLRWLKSDNLPVVITLSPFLVLTALGPEIGTFMGFSVFCSLDSVSFPKIIPSTPEFYLFFIN